MCVDIDFISDHPVSDRNSSPIADANPLLIKSFGAFFLMEKNTDPANFSVASAYYFQPTASIRTSNPALALNQHDL
jgi:hypothetical protein